MVFDCREWISTVNFVAMIFDFGNRNDATLDTHKAFSTMKETSRTFQDNPVPPDTWVGRRSFNLSPFQSPCADRAASLMRISVEAAAKKGHGGSLTAVIG